jgi:hypothetical protein
MNALFLKFLKIMKFKNTEFISVYQEVIIIKLLHSVIKSQVMY